MTATPRTLVRRPTRRIPVTLLALVLLAAGGLAAWLLGTLLVNGSWPASATGAIGQAAALRLDSPAVLVVAGVLAVAGLAMLVAAVKPGNPPRTRVLEGEIAGQTAVSHRDLARRVRLQTERVDGVHSARVQVTRRQVSVLARTVVDDSETVLEAARAAAEESVAELRPVTAFRTRVRIQQMN